MKKKLLKILSGILRTLARLTIRRFNPSIIGITGNVGKTSAKEAIRVVLSQEKRVRASLKSFNNELGLPLTILGDWELESGVFFWFKVIFGALAQLLKKNRSYPEILILEYGVQEPGDMKYLLDIARPNIGIVTAIGDIPVHAEFFSDAEEIAREKSKLISQLPTTGFAILNADDEQVLAMAEQTKAHVITYGFFEGANLVVSNIASRFEGESAGINFKLTYNGSSVPVRLENVLGKAQSYAAAAGAAVGLIFGMNLVKIAEALGSYETPPGRCKIIKGIKGSTIIDDTYNAAPLSMREALEVLRDLRAERKIAVLGDMLELGKYTAEAHEAMGRLAARAVDMLFTVGMRAKFIADAALAVGFTKDKVFAFENLNEAGRLLQDKIQNGDLILLKGSQAVRLEKIVKEIMAEPEKAEKLLVRQNKEWLAKMGIYEGPVV